MVFGSPASPELGNNLLVRGSRILGIIAAHPLPEGVVPSARRGFFIFLDGRAAAVGIVVRFVASGLVDLRDLLLGVDLRLPSGFEPYVVEHPASAGPSELQDGEVLTIGVRPSSSVPFVSAGALSSAASVEVTPAPSSAAASCSIDYPVAVVQSIWFAVFKPDHLPELVQREVDFPASVSEAAEMLALARDRVTSSLYPHLIAADPQPCLEFGCFLGRPDWARDKIQVLVDSRPWDGRLFTIILDPWLQWGSFLLQGGFGTHRVPVVYIKDAPVPPGRPLMLADGALVTVLPSQRGPPALLPLAVMLQRAHMWADAMPAFFSHDPSRFCLLTDGAPLFFTVDRERVRNSEDFRVAAGIALGYREHLQTQCPAHTGLLYPRSAVHICCDCH